VGRVQVPGLAVREFFLQVGDGDVAVAHGAGDVIKGLVRHLHVVAPQGGRRAQQGDIGGRHGTEIERRVIGLLIGQLAASAGSGEEDTDEYGQDRDNEDNRHIRIVPCSTSDVASAAGLRRN
jgi:hypothetical protein